MNSLSKKIDKNKLLESIHHASTNLNTILDSQSVNIILVEDNNTQVIEDCAQQWQGLIKQHWTTLLENRPASLSTFNLALYSGETLSGLCQYSVSTPPLTKRILNIRNIEGQDGNHPLKGYVIPAFSEAALEIGRALNMGELRVLGPKEHTIDSCLRLGFEASKTKGLFKSVHKQASLNWNKLFEYRQSKGQPTPSHFS